MRRKNCSQQYFVQYTSILLLYTNTYKNYKEKWVKETAHNNSLFKTSIFITFSQHTPKNVQESKNRKHYCRIPWQYPLSLCHFLCHNAVQPRTLNNTITRPIFSCYCARNVTPYGEDQVVLMRPCFHYQIYFRLHL